MYTAYTAIVVVCVLAVTAIVFYKTIVTREWRDRAPGERDSWRFGVFYYNKRDARLFLPKRSGLGWTINFAQPLAVVIFVFLLIGLVALAAM